MLNQDPALLLNNKRLSIIPIIEARVAEVHGLIADVGCGSGYFGIYLAKNFDKIERVDAIEASRPAVSEVIPRNAAFHGVDHKVNAKLGSFDDLGENLYDFVFAMGALHHSTNLDRTILSISRSLKKGGYLVAQEPAMPDTTSHREYDIKYNIREERFGLTIRNGDRFDRFFRECEYKCSLVKNGFDILIWEDFLSESRPVVRINMLKLIFDSVKIHGFWKTLQKAFNARDRNRSRNDEQPQWKRDLKAATKNVAPKLLVARKTDLENWYHT